MQLSPSQLDRLVQQVVDQLRGAGVSIGGPPTVDRSSGSPSSGNPSSGRPADSRSADSCTAAPPTLRLDQPLVCLADLPATLPLVGAVQLGSKTVVTPAARDRLRHAGLTLIRLPKGTPSDGDSAATQLPPHPPAAGTTPSAGDPTSCSPPPATAPLLLIGSAPWWPALQRGSWPAGVALAPPAAANAALTAQLAGISPAGDQGLVVVADEAYRLLWEIQQRHSGWCGCVVRDWRELQQICQQLPANLLVLPAASWQPAAVGNLVRHWHRHRQATKAHRG
jgi:hypothetical protein